VIVHNYLHIILYSKIINGEIKAGWSFGTGSALWLEYSADGIIGLQNRPRPSACGRGSEKRRNGVMEWWSIGE
jgi:hypothetical protein